MKRQKHAFTLVEMLTVLFIITILVSLLVPAIMTVRRITKETQQRAQFNTIELGLGAFKNDMGYFPPSTLTQDGEFNPAGDYCGAQKMAEALVGWDLLGFDPNSEWRADGEDDTGFEVYYQGTDQDTQAKDLNERLGPYLELSRTEVYRLGSTPGESDGVFDKFSERTSTLDSQRYVICDVFGVKKVILKSTSALPNAKTESKKAGTPILYYRADPSKMDIDYDGGFSFQDYIYNYYDNLQLINLQTVMSKDVEHVYYGSSGADKFYEDIKDLNVSTTTLPRPVRADSYILISAGPDGIYGNGDDIHNF